MTTLQDILETCTITFKQRVANLIKFGNKGRLLMIKKNAELEEDFKVTEYKSAVFTLEDADLETKIKQALNRNPKKVILFEYKTTMADVIDEVKKLKFDWVFSLETLDQSSVSAFAKENQVFGLVYNVEADSEYVISISNPSAKLANGVKINNSSTIGGIDLLPIAAGLLAGCPYDMSATGFVLTELESVELPETIKETQFTLYNEEEGVRVANPVNTLSTLGANKTEDMKSITIMEGIKRFDTDVKYVFRTGYKGRYKNKYDNQQLFISAAKGYINDLEKNDILDEEYNNNIFVDTDRMRELWIASGKDEDEINAKTDLEIAKLTYKKLMALKADVKFLNAIEACEITVEMF